MKGGHGHILSIYHDSYDTMPYNSLQVRARVSILWMEKDVKKQKGFTMVTEYMGGQDPNPIIC